MSATSTPYVNGMKKPLNMLENPIYPQIYKAPPRFVWSRKHWNVDVGATMRDTEPFTQFIEPAVLAQSRDYNKTVYGQSSHREVVNAEFRPPIISPYEDLGPLTRVPATIHAIIPHINPGTAGHGSGTSGYTAKNERASDVEGALTDRIKSKEWRPTFYAPIEIPRDNSILPDLEMKLPPISVHAGWNIPIYISPQPSETDLGDDKLGNIPIHPGYTTNLKIDGQNGFENYEAFQNRPMFSTTAGINNPIQINGPGMPSADLELLYNRPQVSVSAGENIPMQINAETRIRDLYYNRPQVSVTAGTNNPIQIDSETRIQDLYYNRPQVSVTAGTNNPIQIDAETRIQDLYYNRPQVSVTAGTNNPAQIDAETRIQDLYYNRPQVSVTAGADIPIQINAETKVEDLVTKLGETPIHILSPGSETGYQAQSSIYNNPEENIQQNRPNFSYVVPPEEPTYRSQNVQTHVPHFREKLQPNKSYGQISHSGGAIPRMGVEQPRTNLGGRKKHPYMQEHKKARYRF